MLGAKTIPDTARFRKEESGVKWYADGEGINAIHMMAFDGKVLTGNWVGPRWIFQTLASMSPEERTSYEDEDELMGIITRYIREGNRAANGIRFLSLSEIMAQPDPPPDPQLQEEIQKLSKMFHVDE